MITNCQGFSLCYLFYALKSQAGCIPEASQAEARILQPPAGLIYSMEIADVSSDESEHMSSEKSEVMSSEKTVSLAIRQCSMMTFSALKSTVPYRGSLAMEGSRRITLMWQATVSTSHRSCSFPAPASSASSRKTPSANRGSLSLALAVTSWHFRTSTLRSSS